MIDVTIHFQVRENISLKFLRNELPVLHIKKNKKKMFVTIYNRQLHNSLSNGVYNRMLPSLRMK